MNTILDGLRSVLGTPNFYDVAAGAYDYASMLEYFVGAVILCVVISSVFRLLGKLVAR